MLNTHKKWFRILSFIMSLAFIISSFSSVGRATSARYEVSVIKTDIPKYSANKLSNDINILKDTENKTDSTEGESYETPLEMYNYVRTHIASELGIKYRREADDVKATGKATASENATLLIGMLRDKGYDAKYVHGQAVLSEEQVKYMTGASSIDKAADVYKENGIKPTKLTSNGATIGLIVEHIWVRAYLPMTDYRGAKDNEGEYAWIDLDAYVKNSNLAQVETLDLLPYSLQYETRGLNGNGDPVVSDDIPEDLIASEEEPTTEEKKEEEDNPDESNGLTVLMTSPENDDIVTAPTDIIGTVSCDTGKVEYSIGYRPYGKGDYTEFVSGKESVDNGNLGQLDPTLLANGRYQIRITAKDDKGNSKKVTKTVNIEGSLKVGNYHIGFTDITASMGGTSINVNRIYDSTVKESGDFGYGWSMSMQGLKLYENADLSSGYQQVVSGSAFSTRYQMTETKNHDVIVTYGDGTSDRFELTFNPAMSALRPISEVTLGYKCVTNQKVKLEVLGDTTGTYSSGMILFYELDLFSNPSYRLTTENGEKLYLNKDKGVFRIEDSAGHIVTVDDNGYHSTDGKSVELKRDKQNRVTEAIDPLGNKTTYKYDKNGDLVSVTDSAERTVSYTYDNKHNLISITDPMGIAVSRNEYDNEGRLVATIDADGNRIEFSHDVEGRQEVVKDRRGNSTVYVYDERGNVVQTTDALGNITYNTYDANNNCISKTDANGHTTKYTYDKNGNNISLVVADGTIVKNTFSESNYLTDIKMMDKSIIAMTYDEKGILSSIIDSNGNTTNYSYDENGQITSLSDTIGIYEKMTYDSEGNVLTKTNGAGETFYYSYDNQNRCSSVTIKRFENGKEISLTSRYTYDSADNIVQSVDNAGNITTYEYDANGNQIASVDSKNRRISYEYDDQANLIKIIYPDGSFESFEYDANGNNIAATDRSGLKITMTYDKLDRMISKSYADGNKESFYYDAVGNVIGQVSITGAKTTYKYDERDRNISVTDALGNETTFTYDAQSKLISKTDAKNNTTSYEYDSNGNIVKTVYPDGNEVTSAYDARNRIISQTDQNSNITKYEYDGADKLTKVTDALGHSTEYTYDEVGHVASVKNAAGNTAEYLYDSTGNLISEKDFAGNEIKYSYDDMDRVITKNTSDNNVKYIYTEKGLISSVEDNSGTVSYKYDKYNRLSSYTDVNKVTVSYTYDKYGNVESIDNGFNKTKYEYDSLNRLTRVIDHNGKATVYEYDELGNRSAVCYPNGNVMSYSYDACQRLKEESITNASGKQIAKYSYGLGKAGERLSVSEEETSVDNPSKVIKTQIEYSYDKLNRLIKETISRDSSKLTQEYSYDKVSNRTSKKVSVTGDISVLADIDLEEVEVKTGTTSYTYNELNQLITEKNGSNTTTYTYDANGNLVKEQGIKTKYYTYDSENHLMSAMVQQGNAVTVEEYTYDFAGNRTSKAINEVDITRYINDISGDLTYVLGETDKDGKLKKTYTLGQELISLETKSQVAGIYDETNYFIYDGHGSTRQLTNNKGNVTDRYSYDGYGILLEKEGDTENDFLYTGEQYNYTTELYYLRARYMDPSTGTFISMDSYAGSLSDPVSLHKYLYANANPIMNTDPSGYLTMNLTTALVGMALICATYAILSTLSRNIFNNLQNSVIYSRAVQTVRTVNFAIVVFEVIGIVTITNMSSSQVKKAVDEKYKKEYKKRDDDEKKEFYVYTLVDNNGIVRYVGRTNDYDRRINEHINSPSGKIYQYHLLPGPYYSGLTEYEARGLEQTLMLYYHTLSKRNENKPYYNYVNGVSPSNAKIEDYHVAAEKYFKRYPTYIENQIDNEMNNIEEVIQGWGQK